MPTQGIFLVGGKGTRLGSVTAQTPKPLLPVGGRPFIDYLIENSARFGLRRIVLLAGHLPDEVLRWRKSFSADNLQISIIVEPEPAGTGGALRHAADLLDDTFFLSNGDSFFDFNFLDLATLPAPSDAVARMALRRVQPGQRYGRVQLLPDSNRVLSFVAESASPTAPINGGVYVLKRDILKDIGRGPISIEQDVFPALAQRGLLYGKCYDGFFLDIGIPDDFERAQTLMPDRTRRPAAFLDRDGVINIDSGYVHRPDQFIWIKGARETIRRLNDAGYLVFIVTNQGGVAHGLYSENEVQALHRWMQVELSHLGAHVDEFNYCPFHPDGKVEQYRRTTARRKPGPGMILDCFEKYPINKAASFLIGDRMTDLAAANSAGIPGYLFSGGNLLNYVEDLKIIQPIFTPSTPPYELR